MGSLFNKGELESGMYLNFLLSVERFDSISWEVPRRWNFSAFYVWFSFILEPSFSTLMVLALAFCAADFEGYVFTQMF